MHGIYEVHLPVEDVERATAFYVDRLGFEPSRTPGFRFVDDDRRWMPGFYEAPPRERRHQRERHVSFRVDGAEADGMGDWLGARDIEPVHSPPAPREGPMEEPIVFGWMPTAAVFFEDLDGNLLELVAVLSAEPRSDVGSCRSRSGGPSSGRREQVSDDRSRSLPDLTLASAGPVRPPPAEFNSDHGDPRI